MATITLRPTSASGNSWSNTDNAYDGNESTYASVSVSRFNYSSRHLTLDFDTTVIPLRATINSATLTMRSKAGKNTISAYVDIDGSSQQRVINQKQSTTITNYTADVANYISRLSNILVTVYNSNYLGNTFELYEIWIDVDYTEPTSTTYTVRFLDWDNSVIDTQTVTSGGSATPPPYPTRDGYTFSGWLGDYTNVTSDVDIIAQYTQNSSGSGEDTSVKNIKIGSSTIDKLYLGTTQILKAYLGSILLYSYSTGGGSGGEIGPPASGKNLFNKATAKLNYKMYYFEIGIDIDYVESNGYFCSDYIEVNPNTTYTLSHDGVNSSSFTVVYLDTNKKVLDFSEKNPFTIPSFAKYIMFHENMDYIDTTQLEEGSTATDYEPYR